MSIISELSLVPLSISIKHESMCGDSSTIQTHHKEIEILLKAQLISYNAETNRYCLKFANTTLISKDDFGHSIIVEMDQNQMEIKNFKEKEVKLVKTPMNIDDHTFDSLLNEIDEDRDEFSNPVSPTSAFDDDHDLNIIGNHENHKQKDGEESPKNFFTQQIDENVLDLQTITSKWNVVQKGKYQNLKCDASDFQNCSRIARIYFVLYHFQLWIENGKTKNAELSSNDVIAEADGVGIDGDCGMNGNIMSQFDSMSDFLVHLTDYNIISMTNDFQHIYCKHMTSIDDISHIRQYLTELNTSNCKNESCKIYRRHYDDHNRIYEANSDICSAEIKNGIYFIFKEMDRDYLVKEINLQTKLDNIHCSLLHRIHRPINRNKFVTKVYNQSDGVHAPKGEIVELSKCAWSETVTYWDQKHCKYCAPKYTDLKTELLQNQIYGLKPTSFDILYLSASQFLSSKKAKLFVALRKHLWMKARKQGVIPNGAQITMSHVIALMCYCNIKALHKKFKHLGFKTSDKMSDKQSQMLRHREICNWSRLLLESVHCFGRVIDSDLNYYHTIDRKIVFNRFNHMIDIPSSLTLSSELAMNLCPSNGMVLQFNHGGISDVSSLCLDMSLFSDNPLENEQLVHHTFVSFCDIMIDRKPLKRWLQILRFWLKIKEGFFFEHILSENMKPDGSSGSVNGDNTMNVNNGKYRHQLMNESTVATAMIGNNVSRNDQLWICAMIGNMIVNHAKESNTNGVFKYDDRVPYYIQKLFNASIKQNSFVWCLDCKFDALTPQFKDLLCNKSPFMSFLRDYKRCTVRKVHCFEWVLDREDVQDLMQSNTHKFWIKSEKYKVFLDDAKTEKEPLVFHFECQNRNKNDLFRCKICLDSKPKDISKINIGMGLFCKHLCFDQYSYGEINEKKMYNSSLNSLFPTVLLDKFDSVCFEFQIQIFTIYNRNGQRIGMKQQAYIE